MFGFPTISYVPKIGIHSFQLLSVLKEWIPRRVSFQGVDTLARISSIALYFGLNNVVFLFFIFHLWDLMG